MCDQQTWRSRSFQISQHLRQHLTSFTRHRAKTDHAQSTHYGSPLQLYGISISRHCAQCVDSLCCYLGDRTTAPWSRPRDHNAGAVGNQAESACQTPHSVCVHRPIRFPTATANYTTGPVCCLRRYTGHSHTPTACMQNRLNYRGLPAVPLCISRPLICC